MSRSKGGKADDEPGSDQCGAIGAAVDDDGLQAHQSYSWITYGTATAASRAVVDREREIPGRVSRLVKEPAPDLPSRAARAVVSELSRRHGPAGDARDAVLNEPMSSPRSRLRACKVARRLAESEGGRAAWPEVRSTGSDQPARAGMT
jgi:hypothetical protein